MLAAAGYPAKKVERVTKPEQNIKKLLSLQLPDGSWSWHKGGRGSLYITREIISGLLKLKHQAMFSKDQEQKIEKSIEHSLSFIKQGFIRDYKKLKDRHTDYLDKDYLTASEIQICFLFISP